MQRIVSATDLSPRGEQAVARGAELAQRFGAELVVVHVVDDELPEAVRAAHVAEARELVERALATIGRPVRVRVETGSPHDAIGRVAGEESADLVVVGAHRRRPLRDLFVGTTVERLLRAARCPVLVARSAAPEPYAKVVAAVDLTEEAGAVIALAGKMAAARPVQLVHVRIDPVDVQLALFGATPEVHAEYRLDVAPQVHDLLVRMAERAGIRAVVPRTVHGGPVVGRIAATARDLGADLAVMGTTTHERGPLQRWLLASQAELAVLEAQIDVLCVPLPGATRLPDAPAIP